MRLKSVGNIKFQINEKTGARRNQFRDHSLIGKFNEKMWFSITLKHHELFSKKGLVLTDGLIALWFIFLSICNITKRRQIRKIRHVIIDNLCGYVYAIFIISGYLMFNCWLKINIE